ncbi:hypothetical protein A0U91_05415 [Acetobacter persici]|uniref:Uncharacterized protein n=1 Tax=Acetobacter persici TaxID=1076596 RepID=A0A1U9LDM9_9PROT|nr:hypothetical protein [Acetobacter persici]AQT04497.1 hypothetical protein A0U91_05415 [Acetobacter persici]
MMMPEPVVMIVPVMHVAAMIMSIVIMPVMIMGVIIVVLVLVPVSVPVPVLAAIMRGVRSAVGIMIMVVMVMPAGGGRVGFFSACRGGWLIVRGGVTGCGATGQTVYGIRRRRMVLRCAGGRVRMRAGGRGWWLRHGMSLRVGGGVPVASGRCPA